MIDIEKAFETLDKMTAVNKSVLTELSLLNDYAKYDAYRNFVLVEGSKDKRFYKKVISKNEYCAVGNIINDNQQLNSVGYNNNLQGRIQDRNNIPNMKNDIKTILKNAILSKYSNLVKERNIYGFIDRDFDEPYPANMLQSRVFSDDSHDLEIMMISSDFNVLQDIEDDIVWKALYMAYQIALVKRYLVGDLHYRIPKDIDLNRVFNDVNLNLKTYLDCVNKYSKTSQRVSFEELTKKMRYLKYLDNKNNFKYGFEDFKSLDINSYKHLISGHDLLNLVVYLQKKEGINCNITENELFETILKKYNVECFKKSSIYEKLKTNNLV